MALPTSVFEASTHTYTRGQGKEKRELDAHHRPLAVSGYMFQAEGALAEGNSPTKGTVRAPRGASYGYLNLFE